MLDDNDLCIYDKKIIAQTDIAILYGNHRKVIKQLKSCLWDMGVFIGILCEANFFFIAM